MKQEAKIVYLLECLQKTSPPVLIFCEKKQDVDDIHEYLLLKGVEAVSIHGGKDQDERNDAIARFKDTSKDVLVATGSSVHFPFFLSSYRPHIAFPLIQILLRRVWTFQISSM